MKVQDNGLGKTGTASSSRVTAGWSPQSNSIVVASGKIRDIDSATPV